MKPSPQAGQRPKLESHADLIISEVGEILECFQADQAGLIRLTIPLSQLKSKLVTLKVLSVEPFKELLDVFIENLSNGSMLGRSSEDVYDDVLFLRERIKELSSESESELPSSFDPLLNAVTVEVNKRIGSAMADVLDKMGVVGLIESIRADNARLRGDNYRFRKENMRLSEENLRLADQSSRRKASDLEIAMNETFGPLAILGFSNEAELVDFISGISGDAAIEKRLSNRGRILWHEDKIANLSDSLPPEIYQELLISYRAKFRNVSLAIKELLTQKKNARGGVVVQNEWMNYRPL